MAIKEALFATIDWSQVPRTEHTGESGVAWWRTVETGNVRVREVEYSPGYLADHSCERGHVVMVIEGELVTELVNGESHTLRPGQGYVVGDGQMGHRSRTVGGARILIVD
jgi:quercetin dioxygenase-like cupin family protein